MRRASVNSFGFGGSNAHVVPEESKPWARRTYVSSFRNPSELDDSFFESEATNDALSILVCSAKDEDALVDYIEALRRYLAYPAVQIDLQDLAFTLSERRTHHLHRGFIVTEKKIFNPRALIVGKKSAESPRIGFIFTGQGAQWPSVGKLLVQNNPLADRLLRHLDSVLRKCLVPPSWSLFGKLTFPICKLLCH